MNAASDGASPLRWRTAVVALLLVLSACADDPVAADPSCDEAEIIPFGQTLVRTLDSGDAVLDGTPADYFSIPLETAGTLVVDMSSSRLDPFLLIWDTSRTAPLAQAFDATGTAVVRTATLEMAATASCYLVAASAWETGAEGEYTIRVDFTAS